jgi:hypothetical protein
MFRAGLAARRLCPEQISDIGVHLLDAAVQWVSDLKRLSWFLRGFLLGKNLIVTLYSHLKNLGVSRENAKERECHQLWKKCIFHKNGFCKSEHA